MSEIARLAPNQQMGAAMEAVLIDGDLSKLTPEQRVTYYKKTCDSLGLNYLTKPFAYIRLNGKLTFYALKDCTEQLRKRDGVSIVKLETQLLDGVFVVTAYAQSATGKQDVATGAVPTGNLKGEALANALMKAETKAKRRVTLSICGLGMTDEEEISSIPTAQKIDVDLETGEIETTATVVKDRQLLLENVSAAKDLTELKNAYGKAYTAHQGDLSSMTDITALKDERKKFIEDCQAKTDSVFGDEANPDTQGDGA